MYEYKFVGVAASYRGSKSETSGYESVVAKYAEDGWRLVQIFVPNAAAVPSEYQLIFERRQPGQAA